MRRMLPESANHILDKEILVWKRVSEGEKEADGFIRIPSATYTNYKNGQPFCAAGKTYISFEQLRAKGEEEIWYRDSWGHHEMIGKFRDIYGRKVLYFSIRFPAYDIYDKRDDDRFNRYYFLCENEKLTLIHYADSWNGFMVTEDVEKLDWLVWKRLNEQGWIIWELKNKKEEDMATYYTNNDGTVFCRHRYFVQYFDLKTKEWKTANWNVAEWLAENLAPNNAKVVEITETQAKEKMHNQILDNLDRTELKRFIDMLCQTRTINWNPMTQREDGVYTRGYPRYPDGLFDIFEFLGYNKKYRDHMGTWPKKLLPTDMNLWQIRTALTYLARAEHFCDGAIADAVEDGTILKLLLRLEDLLNAHQGKAQHW